MPARNCAQLPPVFEALMAKGGAHRDQFYKRDAVRALLGMSKLTLEERGAYSTLIDLTMARGKPLDDDDNEMAHELRVDRRIWRRVKAELVRKGRIRIEGGKLIDDACMETLAIRAEERARAVENGSEGGRKSSSNRAAGAQLGASYGAAAGSLPPQNRAPPNENRGLIQGGLNQVEVEVESEEEDLESFLAEDLTVRGELPPIAADSPLLANVVATGVSAAGVVNPSQLHAVFVASAGPRLAIGEPLRNSVGFIATAIAAGCDPDLDMLPVVIDRTFRRGGPIPNWRYFSEAWLERRDARRRAGAAGAAANGAVAQPAPGKAVENPGAEEAA